MKGLMQVGEVRTLGIYEISAGSCSLRVTETTNALKKGKFCTSYFIDHYSAEYQRALCLLSECESANEVSQALSLKGFEVGKIRGVDFCPVGSKLSGNFKNFYFEATPFSFLVSCKNDMNNEPSLMEKNGKSAKKAWQFFKTTKTHKLENLTFAEMRELLASKNIPYHYWCAMD